MLLPDLFQLSIIVRRSDGSDDLGPFFIRFANGLYMDLGRYTGQLFKISDDLIVPRIVAPDRVTQELFGRGNGRVEAALAGKIISRLGIGLPEKEDDRKEEEC